MDEFWRSLYILLPNLESHDFVMVSVLGSSVVDHGFEPWSCQTRGYNIDVCFSSTSYSVETKKSKRLLALNWDNVSAWRGMSTCVLLFQWASAIKIQLSEFVWYKVDIIIISLNVTGSHHDLHYIWTFSQFALHNNHSLSNI